MADPGRPLSGRSAVVSGAARGLGQAIGDALQTAGAEVRGSVRTARDAEPVAARWGTEPLVMDVTDVSAIRSAVDAVFAAGAAPDLLVANAGINRPEPALEIEPDSWDLVHRTNLRGAFFTAQAFARHWTADGTPAGIVFVGSQAGRVAIENRAAYGSSKAGIDQLVRNLAYEWADAGIRVNAVAPTFVKTGLTQDLERSDFGAAVLSRIPIGRLGLPSEVADAVVYLAGPGASLITGQTLVVDGGYTIH
ncbi:SDR family NAD(P)-dependent oxidoreductase [Microlunatus soli]|uniref:NAD(P)-dependent dehydrogenase, short-chain alcohol dehydrogenase family n=1 Tax=Microlunatus soli TaxID=630515 RepID=A0A1H1RHY4_9ACTN|nr:SDR family oxidoreductase [Microlunatus soli]SDS35341.1 NAD(P)-dependent dehydrogenase, short-chain alcohol dehydrogenase family [Microlunatus soli]